MDNWRNNVCAAERLRTRAYASINTPPDRNVPRPQRGDTSAIRSTPHTNRGVTSLQSFNVPCPCASCERCPYFGEAGLCPLLS